MGEAKRRKLAAERKRAELVDDYKERYSPDVYFDNLALASVSLGDRSDLTDRSIVWTINTLLEVLHHPSEPLIKLHIGGYGKDPRELWEIPEVCDYIRRFVMTLMDVEYSAYPPAVQSQFDLSGSPTVFAILQQRLGGRRVDEESVTFIYNCMISFGEGICEDLPS